MAHYKSFDLAKFQKSVLYSLQFRRYAPFDDFGGASGFRFEGDHRDSGSTSLKATSRTYASIFFTTSEILYGYSGSSGTRLVGYAPWTGGLLALRILGDILNPDMKDVVGFADVSLDILEFVKPGVVEFTASTAGGMPLLPGTPDINTTIKVRLDFTEQGALVASGRALAIIFQISKFS